MNAARQFVRQFTEVELPSFGAVRLRSIDGRPDTQDCRAVAEAQASTMVQHEKAFRERRLVLVDPRATSNSNIPMGPWTMPSTPANFAFPRQVTQQFQPACPIPTPRDGGTPQPNCPPVQNCGATPLGFNTFTSAGYPLIGVVVGQFAVGPAIQVTSGRADLYQPGWLYLSARDVANGFVRVLGYLDTAAVNQNSQLAGDNQLNRPIPSDIYDNVGPVALDPWRPFTNTAPQVLNLAFSHVLGPAASVAFTGAFFGGANVSK